MAGAASLVLLRAGELVDNALVAVTGPSASSAERAIGRVLRAHALRWGARAIYPPVAVLYLADEHYRRLGALLSRSSDVMAERVAERLDPDEPPSLRIEIRPHHGHRARMWVTAQPARVPYATTSTVAAPTEPIPVGHSLLALLADGGTDPIAVPAAGLVLGRGGSGAGRLDDPRVSRRHTLISPAGPGVLRCEDLTSRNGTWVDGRRIDDPVELVAGQRLGVGDSRFRVVTATPPRTGR